MILVVKKFSPVALILYGVYLLFCLLAAVMLILFVVISLRAPPTPWGDVSQAVIYHQVSMLSWHSV